MSESIKVSVCCIVFNHEKYLRQCLDGLLMQETNFDYEILVHDDASTDSSAGIIKEYENRYPDKIRPIYQTENQYSKGVRIAVKHIYPKCRGKYIAVCEGDDFWTDVHKLQKQFDAMESQPECAICTHTVCGVDEGGKPVGKLFPDKPFPQGVTTSRDFFRYLFSGESYPFHTSSYFFRNDCIRDILGENCPSFIHTSGSGDVIHMLYLTYRGDVLFLPDKMSCYRMNSVGSWSSRMKANNTMRVRHMEEFIRVLREFDVFTDHEYARWIDEDIARREFSVLKVNFRTKEMKCNYPELYAKMSGVEKLCYTVVQYFPFTKNLMNRVRNIAKG